MKSFQETAIELAGRFGGDFYDLSRKVEAYAQDHDMTPGDVVLFYLAVTAGLVQPFTPENMAPASYAKITAEAYLHFACTVNAEMFLMERQK